MYKFNAIISTGEFHLHKYALPEKRMKLPAVFHYPDKVLLSLGMKMNVRFVLVHTRGGNTLTGRDIILFKVGN